MNNMNDSIKKLFTIGANQTNKENSNSTELFSSKELPETPFTIITNNEDKKSFGVFANYRITKYFDTPEECETDLKIINWNRIVTITTLINEMKPVINLKKI